MIKSYHMIGVSKESYAMLTRVKDHLKSYKENPTFDDAIKCMAGEEIGKKRYDRLGREEVFAGFGSLNWLRKDLEKIGLLISDDKETTGTKSISSNANLSTLPGSQKSI